MSKGGESSVVAELPAYLEDPLIQALDEAEQIGNIGYVPYRGPSVAALDPMQQASIDNTASAASAFGMAQPSTTGGLPAPTTFADGSQGYSTAPLYDDAIRTFQATSPDQYKAISDLFVKQGLGAPTPDSQFYQPSMAPTAPQPPSSPLSGVNPQAATNTNYGASQYSSGSLAPQAATQPMTSEQMMQAAAGSKGGAQPSSASGLWKV
jgi:hypothetical protein